MSVELLPPRHLNAPPQGRDSLSQTVLGVLSREALDALAAHPAYADTARLTLAGWAAREDEDVAMAKTLRDVGLYIAGVWCLQLHAGPGGLTHATLSAVIADWGLTSRGRVATILLYLRFVGMIRPLAGGDGRSNRFEPTMALRRLFQHWLGRELTYATRVLPDVQFAVDRWHEPGFFDRYIAAYGRFMLGGQQSPAPAEPNLNVFTHRRAGMAIVGRIMASADQGGDFPTTGLVTATASELARACHTSRGQVQNVLKAGTESGLLARNAAGDYIVTDLLLEHVRAFLAIHWLSLKWAADQAANPAPGQAGD